MDTLPENSIPKRSVRGAKTSRRIHERIPINSRLVICYRNPSSMSNSIRARPSTSAKLEFSWKRNGRCPSGP